VVDLGPAAAAAYLVKAFFLDLNQFMRLASLLRSWKGIVSFASSMTVVSPIPGVNCVPRRGRDCGVYISGNRNVAMLLTIYHVNTIRRWGDTCPQTIQWQVPRGLMQPGIHLAQRLPLATRDDVGVG